MLKKNMLFGEYINLHTSGLWYTMLVNIKKKDLNAQLHKTFPISLYCAYDS